MRASRSNTSVSGRRCAHERYNLEEHRRRFSVWAAARATQRGLSNAKAETLAEALEYCGVDEFLKSADLDSVGQGEFDERHRQWSRSIVEFLRRRRVAATFGHAAKLLGMYLKAMVVLGPISGTAFARVAHPPIDSKLLSKLSSSDEIKCEHRHAWGEIKWTKLEERRYYALIKELRSCAAADGPFWRLERFWSVTKTKECQPELRR